MTRIFQLRATTTDGLGFSNLLIYDYYSCIINAVQYLEVDGINLFLDDITEVNNLQFVNDIPVGIFPMCLAKDGKWLEEKWNIVLDWVEKISTFRK